MKHRLDLPGPYLVPKGYTNTVFQHVLELTSCLKTFLCLVYIMLSVDRLVQDMDLELMEPLE